MIRLLIAAALLSLYAVVARAGEVQTSFAADELLARRDAAEASFRDQLAELAQWCEGRELTEAAALVRGWLPIRDPLKAYIFKLPESRDPPKHIYSADAVASEFWQRFIELREAQATALLRLAKQAHAAQDYALSFDLVREACRENPDHAQARAILGYERYNGGWALPDTARRLVAGQAHHEKFGWLPARHAKRYEQGQRFFRGRWLTAAEDERLHSAIGSGWRIESEHYVVTTNHSLEEGVGLSRRLEELYDVWRHVFVDYYSPSTTMQRWFEDGDAENSGGSGRGTKTMVRPRHQVTYFRNRDEYKNALRPLQPQIEITLGIYFARPRTAYFFAGDEQYAGTLLHEGTHQLFQETRQTSNAAGTRSNFWAVEAVACYMESLVEHEHWYTLGGPREGRVPAARKRLLEDQFYVPLSEVTWLGMHDLQRDQRLPKIYSQIAGQAWFFLHADGGRHRQPFIETLIAVYTGKADAHTLAKACGKSYEQLDGEYRRFMLTMNDE
ncbi:MAG: hypothetical protein WD894_26455 [Pirellulales bacterium]